MIRRLCGSTVPKALVDTDILSEIFSGVNPHVMKNAADYVAEYRSLTFTSVTLYEIMTGLEQSRATAKMSKVRALLLQNEEVLPLTEDYLFAATILGTLRRTGKEVGTHKWIDNKECTY